MERTLVGPLAVSFWWKVSSESGYDYLRYYLDGVEQKALSGEVSWINEILSLTQGSHTLRWAYTKDGSGKSGSDTGWVDQLVAVPGTFTLLTSPPAITVARGGTGGTTLTTTVWGGFNSAVTFSATGLPAGVTATFNPATIPAPGAGSSAMALTVTSGATLGAYSVRISATGGGAAQTVAVPLIITIPLADALDTSGVVTTGGAAPWFGQSVTTHDGVDAAQAGTIGDGESSFMESTVIGPKTISFWWKVSSEGADYLRYYLDGVEQKAISGEVDWTNENLTLTSGTHILRWEYAKDASLSGGSDTGWVDTLTINSIVTATTVVSSLNPATNGETVTFTAAVSPLGATGKVTFKDGATTIGTGSISISTGIATFSSALLASGSHGISVVYGGDSNHMSSTSSVLNQAVNSQVTITTVTPGLNITVDGTEYISPHIFSWAPGGSHTIAVPKYEGEFAGSRYAFVAWSDKGALSHYIIVPTKATTYIATFGSQYQLTPIAGSGGSVTPAAGNWYNAGATPGIIATAGSGYAFNSWSLIAGSGRILNSASSATTVVMSGPSTVSAAFQAVTPTLSAAIDTLHRSGVTGSIRTWPIILSNTGGSPVTGAQFTNMTLSSNGTCKPVVTTTFPIIVGTVAAHGAATGNVAVDFSSCSTAKQKVIVFNVNIGYSANGGGATGVTNLTGVSQ